jgi:hypothetical protein
MTQAPLGQEPHESDPLDEGGPGQPDVLSPEGEGDPEGRAEPYDDLSSPQTGSTPSANPDPS